MEYDNNKLILIVEDSPEDYDTTLRAFKRVGMKNKIN